MGPSEGARVVFNVATHHKTGKPIAVKVQPEPESLPTHSGTMKKNKDTFGHIRRDDGGPDIFVVPSVCSSFDGMLPSEGARVVFNVAIRHKTGKPMAVNVQPEAESLP